MDYQKTIDYLYQQLPAFQRIGQKAFKKDLTNIELLCQALGNPHKKIRAIHIAGSNGKGSTAHMLSAICQSSGYKTGLYTSPHLVDFRERIKINGQVIHKQTVIRFVKRIKPLIRKIKPSFFEITVAMAFYAFANKKVDIAIVETGLGGRLDSTNILEPLLSIITNISLEHQHILGPDLKSIAGEKAGIIKKNTPVIIGEQKRTTSSVFKNKAKMQNAPLFWADNMFHASKVINEVNSNTYYISNTYDEIFKIICDLKGNYQAANLVTVLSAIEVLNNEKILPIKRSAVQKGLKQIVPLTGLQGRWQMIHHHPDIILDCAHNADGMRSIFTTSLHKDYASIHIIFGCVKDKDLDAIFKCLPKKGKYYLTQASVERAREATDLYNAFQKAGFKNIRSARSPRQAIQWAIDSAGPTDLVLVTGSVFLVADVLKLNVFNDKRTIKN